MERMRVPDSIPEDSSGIVLLSVVSSLPFDPFFLLRGNKYPWPPALYRWFGTTTEMQHLTN